MSTPIAEMKMRDITELLPLSELSTNKVHVTEALIGLDPSGPHFGYILGKARLEEPVTLPYECRLVTVGAIRFTYRLHDPKCCGRWLSNQMTDTSLDYLPQYDEPSFLPDARLIEKYDFIKRFPYGGKAFYERTSDSELQGEDLDCRRFMRQMKFAVRKYDLMKLVRSKVR